MFEYIKGTVTEKTPEYTVLEAFGIGYRIYAPRVFHDLSIQIGEEIILYVSPIYREDSQRLFGFIEKKERELFNKLSDVSGIGPKTALALLSHISFDDILFAIHSSNATHLATTPGIGLKTAQRLIMELKDKVHALSQLIDAKPLHQSSANSQVQDGINALMNLGYNFADAKRAIESTLQENNGLNLSALITKSLAYFRNGQ